MRTINLDEYPIYQILNLIDNGNIDEVIKYAKNENIFADKINTWQRCVVERIKQRLDREGLEYDIVRPD